MDPLSIIITYVVLTAASSISLDVAANGVFELLRPKIFKNKESQEIREALQEVIENLREMGYGHESKILEEKISEITEKTVEIYEKVQGNLVMIRDEILDAINQNFEATKRNLETVNELRRIILEYDLSEPYEIVTKGILDFKVFLHPPFEVKPVERPERDELVATNRNIFIIGKPGVGKTLLLQQIAERLDVEKVVWVRSYFSEIDANRLLKEDLSGKVLILWDDIHDNAEVFYKTVYKVKDKVRDVRVVCAARSTEREKVEKVPISFWVDFEFIEKEIPFLSLEQRKELIKRCSEKTGIEIKANVIEKLSEKSDGTPLYIISVFLDKRYKVTGEILMDDVKTLPTRVVDLWRKYYERLAENEKAFLRCLMILSRINVGGFKDIVEKLYVFGGNTFSEFCDALERLERRLWIVDLGERYECHDVQLEGVPSKDEMLSLVKKFVLSDELDGPSRLTLNFGISGFHYGEIRRARNYSERIFHVGEAIAFIEKSLIICQEFGLKAELSKSLNDTSIFYSELSSLQQTREEKLESLKTALMYVEEAVNICRELGMKTDLSRSLGNASKFYSELSSLQQTREEKLESLKTALMYVEDAVNICRELGMKAELAALLTNASTSHFDLSFLQQTRKEKLESLRAASMLVEEAMEIYRRFGLKAGLSRSLNNASNFYLSLSFLQQIREEKVESIRTAIAYTEEAVEICREVEMKAELAAFLTNASTSHFSLSFLQQTRKEKLESTKMAITHIEEAIRIHRGLRLNAGLSLSLNNASDFYLNLTSLQQTREEKLESLTVGLTYNKEAIEIYRELGMTADLSRSLNIASSLHLDLSSLQQTREEKLESLKTALKYVEEAIRIRREFGIKDDLSKSLNNASNLYSELSSFQQTQEEKIESIRTALTYIEEAIRIKRGLELEDEVSLSLNNASILYSKLSSFQQTQKEKIESIRTALTYIEEAIGIRRELGIKDDLSLSLSNASRFYLELSSLQQTREEKLESSKTAVTYIEEAIRIERELQLEAYLSLSLNIASISYSELSSLQQTREEKLESLKIALTYGEEAIELYRELGLKTKLAASLIDASNLYSELSSLQQTREEKLESLKIALTYGEEAIELYRELGLKTDLFKSLFNTSNLYLNLFSLQQSQEEKIGSLETALTYMEEVIGIHKELGLKADLSMSLTQASGLYSELSSLQQTKEEKIESSKTAITYIEEAIRIRREIGPVLDLAASLTISVFIYDSYLEFDSTAFSKAMINCDQAIDIFLRFRLKEKYCPLLPFGIKYHQIMFTITKSPEHQALLKTYQQSLNYCQ